MHESFRGLEEIYARAGEKKGQRKSERQRGTGQKYCRAIARKIEPHLLIAPDRDSLTLPFAAAHERPYAAQIPPAALGVKREKLSPSNISTWGDAMPRGVPLSVMYNKQLDFQTKVVTALLVGCRDLGCANEKGMDHHMVCGRERRLAVHDC